jgi:hypothetical protein
MPVNLSTFLPGWGTGTLAVEIAWGADLTAAASTWSWTEVTGDVRLDPGISITLGRGDEAGVTQPANAAMRLNNQDGDYSLGGESANWPNVRRGTPVRIRVDPDGSGTLTAFFGFATGFTPAWDSLTGAVTSVSLSAAGTLRRLGQGQSPVQSTLRRALENDAATVAYWPLEEGKEASVFASAVGPHPMQWDAVAPELAANSNMPSSLPLPVLKGSSFAGAVDLYAFAGDIEVSCVWVFSATAQPDQSSVLTIYTSGTAARIEVFYGSTGTLGLFISDSTYTIVDIASDVDFNLDSAPFERLFTLTAVQNGADIDFEWGTLDRTSGTAGYATHTTTGMTIGAVTRVTVNEGLSAVYLDDVALGHVAVKDTITGFFGNAFAFVGFAGEYADDRVRRLATENGELVDVVGVARATMGAQSPATLLELLRECELAEGGVLVDGLDQGLTFYCRDQRENRPVDLTIDAAAGQLAAPFGPVDDDQRTRNKATVTRKNAGTFVHADTSGPLATTAIGIYDTSATVNVGTDIEARAFAEWLVHLGTFEGGYRYPAVAVDLRATPSLAGDALALTPSARIDVVGVDEALTAHPGTDVGLLTEGLSTEIAAGVWRVSAASSPAPPWDVGVLATDTASPTVFVAAGAAQEGNNASLVPPFATGTTVNDLMIIVAAIRNSGTGTVDTPAGWEDMLVSGNVKIMGRVAEFGDAAPTVSFTGGAANATTLAQCFTVGGSAAHRLGVAATVHASAAQLNASAQNIARPALTITVAECMVLAGWWKADDSTIVDNGIGAADGPADMSSTLGDDMSLGVDYLVQSTAASFASGTYTVTGGAAAISRGLLLALLPDPTPPPPVRLDTAGSTLNGSVSAGATSISVTTTTGPLWTTAALDFPFDLDVGGVKCTVTACSDATSPQTMTIASAPVARASGVPVRLHRPPGLSR